jgi:hypothetical protein
MQPYPFTPYLQASVAVAALLIFKVQSAYPGMIMVCVGALLILLGRISG